MLGLVVSRSFLYIAYLLAITSTYIVYLPGQTARADDATISFLETGAGDCILLKCPNSTHEILIDCGSNGIRNKALAYDKPAGTSSTAANDSNFIAPSHFDYDVLDWLTNQISLPLEDAIITHGDSDHYNILDFWLRISSSKEVRGTIAKDFKIPTAKLNKLMLGGVEADYQTIIDTHPKSKDKGRKTFLKLTGSSSYVDNRRFESLESKVSEIARCPISTNSASLVIYKMPVHVPQFVNESGKVDAKKSKEFTHLDWGWGKNDRSLLLLAKYQPATPETDGSDTTYVWLTGDATNTTIDFFLLPIASKISDPVIDQYMLDRSKALKLLKIRHHGSENQIDTGNNPRWIDFVSPDAVVFTSGGVHGHPRCAKVKFVDDYFKNEKRIFPKVEKGPHEVNCYTEVSASHPTKTTYSDQGGTLSTHQPNLSNLTAIEFDFSARKWNHKKVPRTKDLSNVTNIPHVHCHYGHPSRTITPSDRVLRSKKLTGLVNTPNNDVNMTDASKGSCLSKRAADDRSSIIDKQSGKKAKR